jgi:hypothetical protein
MHYKFIHYADIDKVMGEGTILISSLSYFRTLEKNQSAWIADQLEGASELRVERELIAREGSPDLDLLNRANIGLGMFKQFAHVSGGGTIHIGQDTRFVHTFPDVFVYSCSWGNVSQLTKVMCVNAPERYDACLRIRNLRRLERAIFETGIISEIGEVADLFSRGDVRPVEYESLSRSIDEGPVIPPSPYKKDIGFKAQSEMRIMLIPKREIDRDRLIIKISEPQRLFEEAFRVIPDDATRSVLGQ